MSANKGGELVAKEPGPTEKIYKDECAYCFDTPYYPDGLFVCLAKYVGVCQKHLPDYVERTGGKCFLNIKLRKVEPPPEPQNNGEDDEPVQKVQKLQIRAEIKPKEMATYTVHMAPVVAEGVPLSVDAVGAELYRVCQAVIDKPSAGMQAQLDKGVSDWEDDEVKESELIANLPQMHRLDGEKLPYEGWRCEEPGCDMTENLWLNLFDGTILCGRFVYGNPASGKGHAEKHARDSGCSLVVKLGTIESNGAGDHYQYEFNMKGEDQGKSVKNSKLAEHLAFYGLDITRFKKQEKTTLELEIELNNNFEYRICQEEGSSLETAYGPDFTGLVNLGSTCYINSVVQMLAAVPPLLRPYLDSAQQLFANMDVVRGQEDLNWQWVKLLRGLTSGDYSKKDSPLNGIAPKKFRRIVGQGHIEFSTSRQQDAEEFARYFFDKLVAEAPPLPPVGDTAADPVRPFRFHTINRLEDVASGKVRYMDAESSSGETVLALPLPMEAAVEVPVENPTGDTDVPKTKKQLRLEQCLSALFGDEFIDGYISPVSGEAKGAKQTVRMASFPDYLLVQLKRFVLVDLTPKKLDAWVEVDDEIDLGAFRSAGLQPGEQELPADAGPNIGKKAGKKDDEVAVDDAAVCQLTEFGFTPHQAAYSLRKHNNSVDIAAGWLFDHADEVPPEETNLPKPAAGAKIDYTDGAGRYRLRAFVTHMGKSTQCGHYVAHVERNGTWYIYNDEKVAVSQRPPKQFGYLYLYERIQQ